MGEQVVSGVRVGQTWREDNYLYRVVAIDPRWVWVRPARSPRSSPNAVNPSWFEHWELVRDVKVDGG